MDKWHSEVGGEQLCHCIADTNLLYDIIDHLLTFIDRQMAIQSQHRLEPEVFCNCHDADERVVLLDIARKYINDVGVLHQHTVHTQLTFHHQMLDVALDETVE